MQQPSQPTPSNDGCLSLIDRFLDVTVVAIPHRFDAWLLRQPPKAQRYWERQRGCLYLPMILSRCTGVFVLLLAILIAALLRIKQVVRRN